MQRREQSRMQKRRDERQRRRRSRDNSPDESRAKSAESCEMRVNEKRVGTRWKARSNIGAGECAWWRLPRIPKERERGALLAPLAPLTGAAHGRSKALAWSTAYASHRKRVAHAECAPRNKGAYTYSYIHTYKHITLYFILFMIIDNW